jgi:hypothetical protein
LRCETLYAASRSWIHRADALWLAFTDSTSFEVALFEAVQESADVNLYLMAIDRNPKRQRGSTHAELEVLPSLTLRVTIGEKAQLQKA